jgi:hypothetical protein
MGSRVRGQMPGEFPGLVTGLSPAPTGKTFRLPVGRYHIWCSLADHRARGMRARLRVGRV